MTGGGSAMLADLCVVACCSTFTCTPASPDGGVDLPTQPLRRRHVRVLDAGAAQDHGAGGDVTVQPPFSACVRLTR